MHAISGLRKCLFSFRIAYAQYRYAPKRDTNEEELMDDKEILHRITELVNEEHELMSLAEGEGLDDEQRTRVKELEVHLDQCWDLLRQRRARRQAGLNPQGRYYFGGSVGAPVLHILGDSLGLNHDHVGSGVEETPGVPNSPFPVAGALSGEFLGAGSPSGPELDTHLWLGFETRLLYF